MSLTRALNNAQSGLLTSGFRADVAAGNVANSTTPGYVKRTAAIGENMVGGRGNGVRIEGIQRHQDLALSNLKRDALSSSGRADLIAGIYNQLNTQIGTPDSEYGLFSSLENLEASLRELSVTPESSSLQTALLRSTQDVVNQFNSLSDMATNARLDADNNIAREVETVNNALHRISNLNGEIAALNETTSSAAALLDERQRLIDTISEIVPIKEIPRDGGRIELATQDGVYLLTQTVHELSFNAAGILTPDARYNDGTNRLSGLKVGDQDLTPGSNGNFSLSTGTLSAHFTIRDSIGTTFSDQLDSLAGDLIARFSDDAIDPTKVAGAPGLFTDAGNAFDPLNAAGVAKRLSLNAAIDPTQGGTISRFRDGIGALTLGPAGNASILNNYIDALESGNPAPAGSEIVGNFAFSGLVAELTSMIGENRIRHDAIQASTASRTTLLREAELQKSGVDTDVEMQTLLMIEQAYAANAKVIQVVSDMLDRLMQI